MFFREQMQAATQGGKLNFDPELVTLARTLVTFIEQEGLMEAVERFYQDLCSDIPQSFCLYGAVNAIFVVAADMHGMDDGSRFAQEYLNTATFLLGSQHSLDFVESTPWPIHANDILFNVNRAASTPFELAPRVEGDPSQLPAPLSTLSPWPALDLSVALAGAVACQGDARLVAVGTHPTLTLEAVVMLRDFAFDSGQQVLVQRTLGITYKCAVFPDMCAGGAAAENGGSDDPVARLIGQFDSPPPYEDYTLARIKDALAAVGDELRAGSGIDILLCTSPFIVCAVLQKAMGVPMLGYFGLPLLWKRPTDHFDSPSARSEFWGLLDYLVSQPEVVLLTNNPLLSEQIAYQSTGVPLPVVRPQATYTNATYVPTRMKDAMLVSRTKFMWVTLGCAMRHFMPEGYPVSFTVANSDSKLGFREMAAHRAVVLVPWEHALMAFYEFYSMSIPLLMPDAHWAYRLVFDADGNLGSTTSQYLDVSPRCDAVQGCSGARHPLAPFKFESFESRRYWYQYSSFAQFPHIHKFSSVADLLQKLVTLDLGPTSAAMKSFNDVTLLRSTAFWRGAARKMLAGSTTCKASTS